MIRVALLLATLGASVPACAQGVFNSPPVQDVSKFVTPDQVPALAPVQSVNALQGNVTVQSWQRQMSGALDATTGTVTWTFPTAFNNTPTCYDSLAASNVSYSFDTPLVVSVSKTSVTYKVTAHPASLSILSLTLPIALSLTVSPPTGTTLSLTCIGQLP